jgi:hypothetical protein
LKVFLLWSSEEKSRKTCLRWMERTGYTQVFFECARNI